MPPSFDRTKMQHVWVSLSPSHSLAVVEGWWGCDGHVLCLRAEARARIVTGSDAWNLSYYWRPLLSLLLLESRKKIKFFLLDLFSRSSSLSYHLSSSFYNFCTFSVHSFSEWNWNDSRTSHTVCILSSKSDSHFIRLPSMMLLVLRTTVHLLHLRNFFCCFIRLIKFLFWISL